MIKFALMQSVQIKDKEMKTLADCCHIFFKFAE